MLRIWFAAVLALFGAALGLRADAPKETDFKEKLVGKWESVGDDPAVIEFTRDGKVRITFNEDGKKVESGGTYTVGGDAIRLELRLHDGARTSERIKIKELTDKMLLTEDGKSGQVHEFRRK
jgi:uncharacterized protein (TIGR03066 family)